MILFFCGFNFVGVFENCCWFVFWFASLLLLLLSF